MFRNLSEWWRFRQLILALVQRHLRARYRGSILGLLWSFLNPLLLIAVYSLVFRYYIRFNTIEHYSLFMFTGLLPWIWFSSGLLESTASISSGGNLITKALFPPHVLPLVAVLTNLVHFLFAIPLLLGFMAVSGVSFTPALLLLPVVIGLELVFLLGLGLGLSALNVHFRDIQHLLGNFLTLLFFLSPVIYPVSNIPERFKFTMFLNPVALFTQMYHQIFLAGEFPAFSAVAFAAATSLLVFIIGNFIFNHYREDFAELV